MNPKRVPVEHGKLTAHLFAPIWLQRFLLTVSQRWVDTIRYKSHAVAEFGNGTMAGIWMVVPWLPWRTFTTALSYQALNHLAALVGLYEEAAEQFIGSLFGVLFLFHVIVWYQPSTLRRRRLAQVMTSVWSGIFAMFVYANPVGLLPWIHFLFALSSLWAYLWLRLERRGRDRRSDDRRVD